MEGTKIVTVRAYRDEDASLVAKILTRSPELDDTTFAAIAAFAQLQFNRGGKDFRVAEVDGQCVGFLSSTLLDGDERIRHFRIVVDPSVRRQGVARRLYAALLEQGGEVLQSNSQASWLVGNGFLERRGFQLHSTEHLMELRLSQREYATLSSANYSNSIAPLGPLDYEAWQELHNESHQGDQNFSPILDGDLELECAREGALCLGIYEPRAALTGSSSSDAKDALVGLCHAYTLSPGRALLNSLVVSERARRRGLGRALVQAVLARLNSEHQCVELNVMATNKGARALYLGMGFRDFDEILCYRRLR